MLFYALFGAVAFSFGQSQARQTPLQRMAQLAASAQMPLGIVLGTDRLLCTAEYATYPNDVSDARASLLTLARQYQLSAQDFTPMVLRSKRGRGRLNDALSHVYATFPGLSGTMSYMGFVVDGWILSYLHPKQGFAMSLAGNGTEEELTSLPMKDVSLEQVAGHIVTLGHKGLWLAEESVTKRGEVHTTFRVFSYHDDADALMHLSCREPAAQ